MTSITIMWLISVLLCCCSIALMDGQNLWKIGQLYPAVRIPEDALNTARSPVKRKIVLYHNFFRTKVRPTAANMLLISWHDEAARQAKSYADECIFLRHNDAISRTVPNLGGCGQNIFVSSQKAPWFFALKTWFLEYKNFTYGLPISDLRAVGHYTQLVWATTHKVGCGVTKCQGGPWGTFYNYVCNYCPAGNIHNAVQFPYEVGAPCASCPDRCVADKLCSNPCHVKDMYNNCDELVTVDVSICGQGMCNATCNCGTRSIHKNYPWN